MKNDTTVSVTRDLTLMVRAPSARIEVKLSRLSSQVLAATLRAYSGLPNKGVELNAGVFSCVFGEAVVHPKQRPPIVRIDTRRRAAVRV